MVSAYHDDTIRVPNQPPPSPISISSSGKIFDTQLDVFEYLYMQMQMQVEKTIYSFAFSLKALA
ncbi:hypothetical protein AAMO2058_001500100 [Amorphochlora amoebiformis]